MQLDALWDQVVTRKNKIFAISWQRRHCIYSEQVIIFNLCKTAANVVAYLYWTTKLNATWSTMSLVGEQYIFHCFYYIAKYINTSFDLMIHHPCDMLIMIDYNYQYMIKPYRVPWELGKKYDYWGDCWYYDGDRVWLKYWLIKFGWTWERHVAIGVYMTIKWCYVLI